MKLNLLDAISESTVLGEGEFGIVRKGMYENQPVAIKCCKTMANIDYFKAFLKEIKVMSYIGKHKNIVRYFGAVVDRLPQRICLAVIELSPFGNLNSFLRKSGSEEPTASLNVSSQTSSHGNPKTVQFSQSLLVHFCRQIAEGMEFLSSKRVIHGDLATRNVLVFEANVVKITDFELSRKLSSCSNYTKKQKAALSWRWMALESLCYMEFSSQSDVWSFGVTVWEIFTLAQVPFSGIQWATDFVDRLQSGHRLTKPERASQDVCVLQYSKDLWTVRRLRHNWMMKCWQNKPGDRPRFSDCKEFFINLESRTYLVDNAYGTNIDDQAC